MTSIKKALDAGIIDLDAIVQATEAQMFGLENPGFCIACGNEQDGCEPDAREYRCDSCGEHQVYGAAEILIHIA
jgi:hypothetical protein